MLNIGFLTVTKGSLLLVTCGFGPVYIAQGDLY